MKDKDYIKELFSEKLSSHEVPVRSDLWQGIQSQIGNTATQAAAAKGISVATKWVIGIASSVVVAGSVAWFASDSNSGQQPDKPQLSKTEETKLQPSAEEEKGTLSSNESVSPEVDKNKAHSDGTNILNADAPAGTSYIMEAPAPFGFPPLFTENVIEKSTPAASTPAGTPASTNELVAAEPDPVIAASQTASESKPVVGKVQEWVNVFTPNGDGNNDVFELPSENLKDFSVTVFNNKSQLVFTSDNPAFQWDGTSHGEQVPDGEYVYMFVATDLNGNIIKAYKSLTIKRSR